MTGSLGTPVFCFFLFWSSVLVWGLGFLGGGSARAIRHTHVVDSHRVLRPRPDVFLRPILQQQMSLVQQLHLPNAERIVPLINWRNKEWMQQHSHRKRN